VGRQKEFNLGEENHKSKTPDAIPTVFCQNPLTQITVAGYKPTQKCQTATLILTTGVPKWKKSNKKNEELKASSYSDTTVFVFRALPICSPGYK
jgi:hypothetical protein